MEPILQASDLTKTYVVSRGMFAGRQPLRAVNGVSLSLERGSVLGLVGESGCGKTTLGRMLLGLEEPTSGTVRIAGEALTGFNRLQVSRLVQPVFQDPYQSLNPSKRIGGIISLPLRVHETLTGAEQRRRVEEIMELTGLPRRLYNAYPNQISGGQRQRVAIARALIMRPEIVICDEPTSALDVSIQAQILNLLQDLRAELNLSYVLISHNLAVVQHMATDVAVMYLGRVVEYAPSQELFAQPRHPYTQALLESVLTPDPALGIPQTNLGTVFPNPIDPPPGCTFHPRCARAMAVCRTNRPEPLETRRASVECHLYDGEPAGSPASSAAG